MDVDAGVGGEPVTDLDPLVRDGLRWSALQRLASNFMTSTPLRQAPLAGLGIREVSERTGLSVDTLRWYEKEGLLPPIPRDVDGHRLYPEQTVAFIELVVALRRTGLPVADTRAFVDLAGDGASSHGRRIALLERQRDAIHEHQRQLAADLAAVDAKIVHYGELIAAGLDCDGLPVDAATADQQRRTQ